MGRSWLLRLPKKLLAVRLRSRLKYQAEPCRSLVPLFTATFTVAHLRVTLLRVERVGLNFEFLTASDGVKNRRRHRTRNSENRRV
jgi:hypothetical protein